MGDNKEASWWSFETIKEKYHEWEIRHLWPARFLEYIFLFLLVVFVVNYLFARFDLFHTEATSARYMLSALVQSQAAIVAIVVSLTVIAVQLTASAYSPRVIDIFKKNPDMWILLCFYGFSIFYGLFLLKLVKELEGAFVNQSAIWPLFHPIISLEHGVSIAYWLGAFTFVIIIPYFWNIINLLKPENIINRLKVNITKDPLSNSKEDPIQPIIDIVHGSIMKYDIATTRVGLKTVTERVIEIVDSDGKKEISERFCKHLERVGRLAASRADVESTVEVIVNLDNFGRSTAEEGFRVATLQAVLSLGLVGEAAAETGLVGALREAAWSLGLVGIAAKGVDGAIPQVAMSLGRIGKTAAKKGVDGAIPQIVWSLGEVGRTAVEERLNSATSKAAKYLADLTILSEEIVKTEIQNYESNLKGQPRDSFYKFKKRYEQELEKLRAEKKNAE